MEIPWHTFKLGKFYQISKGRFAVRLGPIDRATPVVISKNPSFSLKGNVSVYAAKSKDVRSFVGWVISCPKLRDFLMFNGHLHITWVPLDVSFRNRKRRIKVVSLVGIKLYILDGEVITTVRRKQVEEGFMVKRRRVLYNRKEAI